jgi:NitT/TauT family transport system permease protein
MVLALPPAATFVVVVLAIEVGIRVLHPPGYLVCPPSVVLATLVRDGAELWNAALMTATAAFLGFALSCVAGILIAIGLSSARWVQRALYPYAIFFQTVPVVAIAPLLVIWIGYGVPTVVASAFIVSVFPVIANTLTGLLSTDPALLDLFRLYGARRLTTLVKLRGPMALPGIIAGMRVAAGLAVIGAVIGEFITGGGIGGVIDSARTQQRVDKVFAGILLASVVGLMFFVAINLLSYLALRRWHPSERR